MDSGTETETIDSPSILELPTKYNLPIDYEIVELQFKIRLNKREIIKQRRYRNFGKYYMNILKFKSIIRRDIRKFFKSYRGTYKRILNEIFRILLELFNVITYNNENYSLILRKLYYINNYMGDMLIELEQAKSKYLEEVIYLMGTFYKRMFCFIPNVYEILEELNEILIDEDDNERKEENKEFIKNEELDLSLKEEVEIPDYSSPTPVICYHPHFEYLYHPLGYPNIFKACICASLPSVMYYILKDKSNLDLANENDYLMTPIHYACYLGHVNICEFLITEGAYLEPHESMTKATPMHLAALQGHLIILQLLVYVKANFNSRDANDDPPLHLAIRENNVDCVKFLIEQGVRTNIINVFNETARDIALEYQREEILQFL